MSRPFKRRRIGRMPCSPCFKPAGIAGHSLENIILSLDEFEALRLSDLLEKEQEAAAESMKVSRQTFGNILHSARNKTADCLINGKILKIEGGPVNLAQCPRRKGLCRKGRCCGKTGYKGEPK